jgi:hypothetical protein
MQRGMECSIPSGVIWGTIGRYPMGIIIYMLLCIIMYGGHF